MSRARSGVTVWLAMTHGLFWPGDGSVAGATDTENDRVQKLQTPNWYAPQIMSAEEIAEEGLKQLTRKPIHIAGAVNRLCAFITGRLLPRSIAGKIIVVRYRKRYGAVE